LPLKFDHFKFLSPKIAFSKKKISPKKNFQTRLSLYPSKDDAVQKVLLDFLIYFFHPQKDFLMKGEGGASGDNLIKRRDLR